MDSDNRKENMENNTRSLEDQSFMNMILEESAWLFSAPLTQQTQCDPCADVDTTSCPSYQDPLPYAMEQSQNLTLMDGCVPDTSAHGRSATMNADAETVCVKNELKQRIQRRRQASGLDELQVEMTDPRPEQLTPHDLERRDRRKAQNRRAAQRSREKKRRHGQSVREEHLDLKKQNQLLRQQVQGLQSEITSLSTAFSQHLITCNKLAAPGECQTPHQRLEP